MIVYTASMSGERAGAPPSTHNDFLTHLVATYLNALQNAGWQLRGSSTKVARASDSVPALFDFSMVAHRETAYPSTGPLTPERLFNTFRDDVLTAGFGVKSFHINVQP